MGMSAVILLWKIWKRPSYRPFWPIKYCIFGRTDVFDEIWAMTPGGLSCKVWKKWYVASCFCEKGSFERKHWHESIVFFRERTFSVKNGHERDNCSSKIGKKGILLTILAHNIYCNYHKILSFWQKWCFFDEIW